MLRLNRLLLILLICISGILCTSCAMSNQKDIENILDSKQEIQPLELVNSTGVVNQGCLTVSGEIKNISEYNITKVDIVAIIYDSNQNEIAKLSDVCNDLLLPNDTYRFKIVSLKKDSASYSLQITPTIEDTSLVVLDIFK